MRQAGHAPIRVAVEVEGWGGGRGETREEEGRVEDCLANAVQ
jgi:hypothetical protein